MAGLRPDSSFKPAPIRGPKGTEGINPPGPPDGRLSAWVWTGSRRGSRSARAGSRVCGRGRPPGSGNRPLRLLPTPFASGGGLDAGSPRVRFAYPGYGRVAAQGVRSRWTGRGGADRGTARRIGRRIGDGSPAGAARHDEASCWQAGAGTQAERRRRRSAAPRQKGRRRRTRCTTPSGRPGAVIFPSGTTTCTCPIPAPSSTTSCGSE